MDPALLLFAFAAGAAAFFAPCCVAMMPAYIGYAVRPSTRPDTREATLATLRPTSPASVRSGNLFALFGLVPFGLGAFPLVLHGINSLANSALAQRLPSVGFSVGMLVLGALAIAAGLVVAGKGPAAYRGALFGGLATAGFFVVYLAIGLPIAFLARGLTAYLTWIAAVVGVLLVGLGLLLLFGKTIAPKLPLLKADVVSPKGFFLFGITYGLASLSCTFPVFLAVIAAGVVSGGFVSAIAVFATYALGKGSLLIAVTTVTVAGGSSLGGRVRRWTPYVNRASAYLLILAGGYIAYYFGRVAAGV